MRRRTRRAATTPATRISSSLSARRCGYRVAASTPLGGRAAGRGQDFEAAELGYMLGHDRSHAYLKTDADTMTRLHAARDHMATAPLGADLYSAWLDAIRALAQKPSGATPSFM